MKHWKEKDNQLMAEFQFKDFREAMAFMMEVSFEAEALNHHPEWSNVYNRVHFRLRTHDEGNVVTDKDRQLAKGIDAIYNKYES